MINHFFKVNLTNNHEPATSMLKRTATVLLALMTSATTWAGDNKAGIVAVVNHQKGKDVEGFSLPAADVNYDGEADGKDAELISKMIMEEREEK